MVAIPLRIFVFGAILFLAYQFGLSIWSALPGDLRDPLHTVFGFVLLALFIFMALGLALMARERIQRAVHGPSAAELAKAKEDDERRRYVLAHLEDIERRGGFMDELDRADLAFYRAEERRRGRAATDR